MTPLPPALARLGRVLGLSTGFSLHVVTGPRDHVDSVYLRLLRGLGGYDLVRHRVHADGVQLYDALAGGDGARPRVVLLSGLERMADEARREATARLNVHRDAWASHPTQVIVWLPAWGLREFKDLAPDLFHWCRSLTILHDADLPVRDELEYLVWACERYRHAGDVGPHDFGGRATDSPVWSTLDPTEREILGMRATYALALDRLARRTRDERLDVEVLAGHGDGEREVGVPVLVRAIDAAGHLEADRGWQGLVGAAGIPACDETAAVFAGLAETGALLCLFDGFPDPSMSDPWFRWLEQAYPRTRTIRLHASLDLPGASFDPRIGGRRSYERRSIDELLARLFPSVEELVGFAEFLFRDEIVGVLPDPATTAPTAWRAAFVRVCEERRLIDAGFFAELWRMRPQATAEIEEVARDYLTG